MNKSKMTTVFTRMLSNGKYELRYWDGKTVNNKKYDSKDAALKATYNIFGKNTIIHDEYAVVYLEN